MRRAPFFDELVGLGGSDLAHELLGLKAHHQDDERCEDDLAGHGCEGLEPVAPKRVRARAR